MWSASWLLCEFVSTSELCQCVLCVLLLARPLTSISNPYSRSVRQNYSIIVS